MALIKKQKATNLGKDVEELEPLHAAGGSKKWCSHCGKEYGGSFKN